ncbi:MAG: hypothetical protein COA42_07540 [Alteromonadaceae bacterium]|nr:MAG: hypothetical protein COA42_07540 [Alteromonadaceae bacterium]
MSTKTALIVDDSKTAQFRLKKLLRIYDVIVNVAFSAEQALASLPTLAPDIIFMDHHMDGMDGLEALKIIKGNPSTAMIPVIMYTAQRGDVYVSHARALGALDTLSKDTFKKSNLDNLMKRLHIKLHNEQDKEDENVNSQPALTETTETQATPELPSAAESRLMRANKKSSTVFDPLSIAEAPYLDAPESETPPNDQTKQEALLADIKRQLTSQAKQFKKLQHKFDHISIDDIRVDDIPLSVINGEAQAERARAGFLSNTLITLILIGIAAIAFILHRSTQQVGTLNNSVINLSEQQATSNAAKTKAANTTSLSGKSTATELNPKALIDTLSWVMTIDMQYPFNESPLDEGQVLNIQNLVYKLSQSGFSGFIQLKIHFGNYCLARQSETANWMLASDDTALSECTFYEDINIDETPESYVSIPFIQFEQSSIPIQSGEINIALDIAGFSQPSKSYPPISGISSASEWNAIAARNNRVTFELNFDGR